VKSTDVSKDVLFALTYVMRMYYAYVLPTVLKRTIFLTINTVFDLKIITIITEDNDVEKLLYFNGCSIC